MTPIRESERSSIRLMNRVHRDARNPSEKISQLGLRSSMRIFPASRSYVVVASSTRTPDSFARSSAAIGR